MPASSSPALVSAALRVQRQGNGQSPLVFDNIKAPKNGYCYVYVSNEASEMVYFDNLQVSHERGRIVEENHYYAYGLKITGISSKKLGDVNEGQLKNEYLYNDKELFDDADLNWYDYGFRNYDPQIGRFIQLDPLTDDYPELTPYQYASCEPIANIDMDGLEKSTATKVVTAAGKMSVSITPATQAVQQTALKVVTKETAKVVAMEVAKKSPGLFTRVAIFTTKAIGMTIGFVLSPANGHQPYRTWEVAPPGFTLGPGNTLIPNPQPNPQAKPQEEDDDENNKPKTFYVTYTKRNPATGSVYSGRTSGKCQCKNGAEPTKAEADRAVDGRERNHAILKDEGFDAAVTDKYSTDKAAIRGREQDLVDNNGGAQRDGGYSRNKIRAVSRKNAAYYQSVSQKKYGKLKNNNPTDQ